MAGSDVVSTISEEAVLRHSEINTLRLISDTLNRMGGTMQTLTDDVREVRESVIRIEAQEVKQQLIDIRADMKATNIRVSELEGDRNKRDGAVGFVSWIGRNFPWIAGLAVAAVVYFQAKHS